MRTLFLSSTLVALVVGTTPIMASDLSVGHRIAGTQAFEGLGDDNSIFDRRGRGRGRGGDDRRGGHGADDGRTNDSRSGGHGGRPRVPGGSGCDDAHDVAEHPECRG
ncbi:hypothetical protein [Rubellimicrobium roseum]|uniref:Uncharacterized protein n=1 Tax=Rubellimicrobium roseum TaxID=687525 RepID=A0A5C4NB87_9RHOB|nr:hypothetical protein [Rubellimicrobium roseum]TNC62078.1 hypothetical protein FHG71_20585 [Rubellimicrobium roseum]